MTSLPHPLPPSSTADMTTFDTGLSPQRQGPSRYHGGDSGPSLEACASSSSCSPSTNLSSITAEFDALSQMSWISSGYFLTLLSFNLLYSQFMNIFPSKHVMIFAILGFNAGSLVCGLAPNMTVLIIGRVISGAGAAGLFGSGMVIIAELTPLHSRGQYFSGFGIWYVVQVAKSSGYRQEKAIRGCYGWRPRRWGWIRRAGG
ncbi:hypothetical protein C370_07438 [Cryptococcus neoformans A1-35-8]|nr:hypothetical protein C370_07438 [Cryptococcus neoformans var. grubii A1-35-8]